jgi:transcription elongation factor GreA
MPYKTHGGMMIVPSAIITQEGYEKLLEELAYLRDVKRKEIADRLRDALEGEDMGGDLEAGYEATKQEQAFVEGRIRELEALLSNPELVEECEGDVVGVGAVVTIQEDGVEPEVYKIVGAVEASPRDGRISNESPLGVALMGHCPGDDVIVEAPGGLFTVRVLNVE